MKTVLNDLYDYDMQIYQLEEGFKFSLDSLLLAEFVQPKNSKQIILDLCTGNASVPLVLSSKYKNKIYGMELQEPIYNLAVKSVKHNHKENQIFLINDNISNSLNYFSKEEIDIITCNPPYFKYEDTSIINASSLKAIARHEVKITLKDIIELVSGLLKNNGEFYLVHRSSRLEEIIKIMSSYNLHIKKLVPIYTTSNKEAPLILIKAVKNGKPGLKLLPAVYSSTLSTFKNLF